MWVANSLSYLTSPGLVETAILTIEYGRFLKIDKYELIEFIAPIIVGNLGLSRDLFQLKSEWSKVFYSPWKWKNIFLLKK